VVDGDVAVRRPVTRGRSTDIDVEIVAGLSEGEVLVTEGQLLLEDGMKVRLANATDIE
jgi:multidrug efflux pump subunit AcrA (membrane-fusion protein)